MNRVGEVSAKSPPSLRLVTTTHIFRRNLTGGIIYTEKHKWELEHDHFEHPHGNDNVSESRGPKIDTDDSEAAGGNYAAP